MSFLNQMMKVGLCFQVRWLIWVKINAYLAGEKMGICNFLREFECKTGTQITAIEEREGEEKIPQ